MLALPQASEGSQMILGWRNGVTIKSYVQDGDRLIQLQIL